MNRVSAWNFPWTELRVFPIQTKLQDVKIFMNRSVYLYFFDPCCFKFQSALNSFARFNRAATNSGRTVLIHVNFTASAAAVI